LIATMPTDDYLADYALLGLQPGCSLETLERTWRVAVRDLHPDRAQDGLDRDARTQRLHRMTGAYRRLRGFEREHGRLPGGLMKPAAVAAEMRAPDAATESAQPPGTDAQAAALLGAEPRLGRSSLIAVPALAVVGLLLWASLQSEQSPSAHADVALASPSPTLPLGAGAAVAPPLRPGQRIRIGSTEVQVERLLGSPLVTEPDLWQYGPSHVRFERGRVVGWYSSPLMPLPVDMESR